MTDSNLAGDWLVIEQSYGAAIELVWEMWTDPAHFAAWYGPAGATIPEARLDVRVGGQRTICMEMSTPNGPMQMWFTGEYVEVSAPHRLAYTEAMADADGTRLVLTHRGVPADSPGAMGWNMALAKLADRLRI